MWQGAGPCLPPPTFDLLLIFMWTIYICWNFCSYRPPSTSKITQSCLHHCSIDLLKHNLILLQNRFIVQTSNSSCMQLLSTKMIIEPEKSAPISVPSGTTLPRPASFCLGSLHTMRNDKLVSHLLQIRNQRMQENIHIKETISKSKFKHTCTSHFSKLW